MPTRLWPPWFKRILVPLWNATYWRGRRLEEFLSALAHRRWGHCEVCGRPALWLVRPGVIPPRLRALWGLTPALAEALARKESSDCSRCGAKLRARRLARVILDLYPTHPSETPARSLADWVTSPGARSLRVAEINQVDGLHAVLSRLPQFTSSDFAPGASPGAVVAGVRSEDLCRLTYEGDAFDLIVTSETLEHVPDLTAALAELRRVLAPGGRHVFTIPVLPGVERTFPRANLGPDGLIEDLAPRIHHPGGDAGYPVFTEFGADVTQILQRAGFEVDVMFGPVREDELAQVYVARRPAGG